jgi:hypothetical protein
VWTRGHCCDGKRVFMLGPHRIDWLISRRQELAQCRLKEERPEAGHSLSADCRREYVRTEGYYAQPYDGSSFYERKIMINTQTGDLWQMGRHRVLCGNSLHDTSYQSLLGNGALRSAGRRSSPS